MAAAFAAGPGIARAAPPANDNFADAQTLGVGAQLLGTTLDATAETGEQDVDKGHAYADECGAINGPRCTSSVWYTFSVASTGTYTIETCDMGTDFDTVLQVWTGTTLAGLTEVVSDDDSCAGNDDGNGSRVTFTATSGTTYSVEVAGYAAAQGMFYVRSYAGAAQPTPEPDTDISKENSFRNDAIGGGFGGSGPRDNASFSFISDTPGATFQCALDGGAFAPCSSPVSMDVTGTHDFTVDSIVSGVADPTPAVQRFTIDHTPPDTSITMNPTDPTANPDVSFTSLSTERNPANEFSCSLDGTDVSPCESGPAYQGLCNATHTFRTAAFDFASNLDPTPASYSFTETGGGACADPEFGTLSTTQQGPTTQGLVIPLNLHGEPGSIELQYGTTTAYGERLVQSVNPDDTNFSTGTGPLQPGTLYHWRVAVTTPHGTVDSGDQTFTTAPLGGDTVPSVSLGTPVVVGNHAAAIPVTVNPGSQKGSYAVEVDTQTTNLGSPKFFGRDDLAASSGPASRVIDIVDLDPGTYHLRGYINQEAGDFNQAQSGDVEFTVPAKPSGPPVSPPPTTPVQKFKFRRGFVKVGKFGRHSKAITLVISHLPPSTSVGVTVRAQITAAKVKVLGRGRAKAGKAGVARVKVKLSRKARKVLRSKRTKSLSLQVRVKPPGQSTSSITLHRRLKR